MEVQLDRLDFTEQTDGPSPLTALPGIGSPYRRGRFRSPPPKKWAIAYHPNPWQLGRAGSVPSFCEMFELARDIR